MTPNSLNVLLHYHCVCEPHPRKDAPAVKQETAHFLRIGIIEAEPNGRNGSGYVTTDKGKAWVDLILATPKPVCMWVDPRSIKEEL